MESSPISPLLICSRAFEFHSKRNKSGTLTVALSREEIKLDTYWVTMWPWSYLAPGGVHAHSLCEGWVGSMCQETLSYPCLTRGCHSSVCVCVCVCVCVYVCMYLIYAQKKTRRQIQVHQCVKLGYFCCWNYRWVLFSPKSSFCF